MTEPRRLLFLNWRDTSHPEGGGAERYLEQLAAGLAANGHEVAIHCAAHSGAPREEYRDGVRILRRGGRLTVYPHGLRAVRRERPDVVVDVLNHLPFFSVLVHRRVVALVHHTNPAQWAAVFGRPVGALGAWIESRLTPWLYRRVPYVAVSGPTRADLVAMGVAAERIAIAHNAADPAPPGSVAPRTTYPSVCVIARMMPHKQVAHAVEVAARLAADLPDLRIRVIGDGPLRPGVSALVAQLGVHRQVELLGAVDEETKHRVLAASWVLLCPSQKEGWGRVVMEAAVYGVPSVAYRHAGGLAESIRHGETGLLADDLDGLAKNTRYLLEHPAERERLGRAAAAFAATFTPERTVSEFSAVLAQLP